MLSLHGRCQPGQRVLIIDDLVNRGGSIVHMAEVLRKEGLVVSDAVVLIDRQSGAKERLREQRINVSSILGVETMLNYLMSTGKIEERLYRKALDYITDVRAGNGPSH